MNNDEGFSSEGDTEIICNNAGRILWGAAAVVGAIGLTAGIIYGIVRYEMNKDNIPYSNRMPEAEVDSQVENSGLIEKIGGGN